MQKPISVELVNEFGEHAVCMKLNGHAALLDAMEVDRLVETLTQFRATMRPVVPKEPSRTRQYLLEIDPSWYTERNPHFDGAIVFLRHTGLGWAGFALPTESLHRLSAAIGAQEAAARHESHGLPN
jgi:hypothetical protein